MLPSHDLLSDLLLENDLLRDKNSELEEENDKLYEELAEKTTPRYEVVAYTLFVIIWAMTVGMALQATF
jgi:hypothetical protein